MIGLSSSHTAGAARTGNIARIIADDDIKHVDFVLHGSFARANRGQTTFLFNAKSTSRPPVKKYSGPN